MRLSVSNIAWHPREDEAVTGLLRRFGVDAIDVAPGKYFPKPHDAQEAEIHRVRSWWNDQGIEITGMQALLFGTAGLNLFASPPVRADMLAHLAAVCRIGAGLGATRLVFGSPKNRDRLSLSDEEVAEVAVAFFRRLGDIAGDHGVLICLEPNPVRYGCNFLTGTDEAARMVRLVGHGTIRLQLDTGTIAINGEDPALLVAQHGDIIGHVHASEPDLAPLGDGGAPHGDVARALRSHTKIRLVAIEMLETRKEKPIEAIERALRTADQSYRLENVGGTGAS